MLQFSGSVSAMHKRCPRASALCWGGHECGHDGQNVHGEREPWASFLFGLLCGVGHMLCVC